METLFSILYFILSSGGNSDFRDDMIYNGIFKATLIAILSAGFGVSMLYYLVLNRGPIKMDRLWHWFFFMAFPVLIAGTLAAYLIESLSDAYVPSDGESVLFILNSAALAAIFYSIGAVLFRKLSTHARYTPL